MSRIWNFIARQCAKPAVTGRIIKSARRTPYCDIYNDGRLYMKRWWLLPKWCLQHDESLGCLMPKKWMPFSIRVHQIIRPDGDRHLHDHPFSFRSIVLKGWYTEATLDGRRLRGAGQTYHAKAKRWHRIAEVAHHGAWSLFIMGKRTNEWGFLVGNKKVHWKEYLRQKALRRELAQKQFVRMVAEQRSKPQKSRLSRQEWDKDRAAFMRGK